MEELLIQINAKARTCKLETEGFTGDACLDLAALKAAIGQETHIEMKPDAHSVRLNVTRKTSVQHE